MKIQAFICVLVFLVGFQGGFLLKTYLEYKYGPVPMITPSEIMNVLIEKR